MISEVHINNLSVVESLQVKFQKGFHVISGETGAGKSILLQAIAFALGARADVDLIRSGAEEATVTLLIDPEKLPSLSRLGEGLGVDLVNEEGLLYLKRTLNQNGRSRAFVNDDPVTLKTLQTLGESLVHIVGQGAAGQLFEEKFLQNLVDRYGGHESLLASYHEAYRQFHQALAEKEAFLERLNQAREQEDFLRFQYEELQKAKLREGEEEELEARKNRMKHKVALVTQTYEINLALAESEDSISDRLGRVRTLAEKAVSFDESLQEVVQSLSDAVQAVDVAARFLGNYSSQLTEDPAELEQIEDRLASLADLKRKYRLDEKGLIQKLKELAQKMGELENFEGLQEEKEKTLEVAAQKVSGSAEALHSKRKIAGKKLATQIEKVLKDLALPHSRIQFFLQKFENMTSFNPDGPDTLSLLVSFNPGEELRPLAEVISGGELSRLLLALYEILFPPDQFGTLLFDEVDTGVGGKAAELIGRKLEVLSKKSQVFSVTHLPQIACHADWQYLVEKEVRQGRTYSQIRLLKNEEREVEIARMLAGVKVTEQALKHARELLRNAAA